MKDRGSAWLWPLLCGLLFCGGCGEEAEAPAQPSYPITDVKVEKYISYKLAHPTLPHLTGDLWPCAWGDDDRLYTSNGDGLGFGRVPADIVFNVVEGLPPKMKGSSPDWATGELIAGVWGPRAEEVNRKPTGLVCLDGDLYLFFQNLKNGLSKNEFGDAPHASISVSRDHGETWKYDKTRPMFTGHVFTTGFFLDYGKCQADAVDGYTYVYGLDYNWRYSEGFSQTRLHLARVPNKQILDITKWEFFTGLSAGKPGWSASIGAKKPVLEDATLYTKKKSGIAQGSVVYIPRLRRYLYSTRARYEWIFYEAPQPWGPWRKVGLTKWTGKWTEKFHAGYNAVMSTRLLDADGRGGWIISSLSSSTFGGKYYNMGFRRFWLTVEEPK